MNRLQTFQTIRALPLAILFILSAMIAMGLFNGSHKSQELLVGKKVPLFNVQVIGKDPTKHLTVNQWHGKVAVLSFFASWCQPCQADHEALMTLARTGKVPIYGIAWKDSDQKVAQWLTTKGNPYQVIGMDPTGLTTIPFALTGVPETFVISKEGVIRYHHLAALTQDDVVNVILPLVDKLNGK